MNKKELMVIGVLTLLSAIVWAFAPEIKVSGQTTTRYETVSPYQKTWYNGMGTTVIVHYVSPAMAKQEERWARWADLVRENTFFWVEVQEQIGPHFLMVDLPYSATTLQDDQRHEYRLLNQDITAVNQDKTLRTLLTTFDRTLFNNAFPGEPLPLREPGGEGILLFEPLLSDAHTFHLHLHHYMSGQKSSEIDFNFER